MALHACAAVQRLHSTPVCSPALFVHGNMATLRAPTEEFNAPHTPLRASNTGPRAWESGPVRVRSSDADKLHSSSGLFVSTDAVSGAVVRTPLKCVRTVVEPFYKPHLALPTKGTGLRYVYVFHCLPKPRRVLPAPQSHAHPASSSHHASARACVHGPDPCRCRASPPLTATTLSSCSIPSRSIPSRSTPSVSTPDAQRLRDRSVHRFNCAIYFTLALSSQHWLSFSPSGSLARTSCM